jgi:large subunit ribosomal protein L25
MKSQALQLPVKEFMFVYKKAHETHIVYLQFKGQEIPVLIQNVQHHPVTDILLHVDFRKVNLKKKIETEIPIKLIGESEAVHLNKGILLTLNETLLIEALPEDLPEDVEIDISILKEMNDEIKIKDLKAKGPYEFKGDPEQTIVRISEHKEEDITPQVVAPETVEITGEKKEEPAEGEEGATEESPKQEKAE